MKCESKYCNNELIPDKDVWDKDWLNNPRDDDKYYSRDFMGKKLCTDCFSLEWY